MKVRTVELTTQHRGDDSALRELARLVLKGKPRQAVVRNFLSNSSSSLVLDTSAIMNAHAFVEESVIVVATQRIMRSVNQTILHAFQGRLHWIPSWVNDDVVQCNLRIQLRNQFRTGYCGWLYTPL